MDSGRTSEQIDGIGPAMVASTHFPAGAQPIAEQRILRHTEPCASPHHHLHRYCNPFLHPPLLLMDTTQRAGRTILPFERYWHRRVHIFRLPFANCNTLIHIGEEVHPAAAEPALPELDERPARPATKIQEDVFCGASTAQLLQQNLCVGGCSLSHPRQRVKAICLLPEQLAHE